MIAVERPNAATTVLAGGELRYSAVWEDHRLLERGLGSPRDATLLVVTSAGDNVLNLLRHAPRRIDAVDVNPAQSALLALKLAALRTLVHDDLLALLGIADHADRLALYDRVRRLLDDGARDWWDAHTALIERGIDRAGRLDRFFEHFRERALAVPARRALVLRLLSASSPAEQREIAEALFTPAFDEAFRTHFSRESLGTYGRDPSQFAHVVADDVGDRLLRRLQRACTALPTRDNHYLERFLLGAPRDPRSGPPYLRRTHHSALAALAARVTVVTAPLDAHLAAARAGEYDGAALSDVFEYLATDESDALFTEVARTLAPGGRAAYWNLFVRRRSPHGRTALRRLDALSDTLTAQDRAWFYESFNVEEAGR